MNPKLQTRAFELVAPMMQPGEQPIVATRANVGSFSSGRFGATLKQAMLIEGAEALAAAMGQPAA